MRFLRLSLLFFCLNAGFAIAQVSPGMTEAELLQAKGKPTAKASNGKKAIYRWPDMEVVLVEGEVVSFKARDPEIDRQAQARRARLAEEARARNGVAQPSSSAPAAFPPIKTELERANERVARLQQIASLRDQINGQRSVIEQYSRHFSNPKEYPGVVTSEQKDLAHALIEKYELEIRELEKLQ